MEYLDVLNSDGTPTGAAKPRDEVHRQGDWHKTVHVWILNYDREILIQKRSDNCEAYAGFWDISCAGHVAAGDTPDITAIRELREELGITADLSELQFFGSVKNTLITNSGKYIDNQLTDIFILKANLKYSEITLQQSEVSAVKFIPLKELIELQKKNDPDFFPRAESYWKKLGQLI